MLELDKFKLKKVKEENGFGEFEIGPLPKGFGHTIANSIRRILLSSIEGAAVTSVKLNGVEHEYTSLDGIQDDILAVLLRLKELALVVHTEDEVVLKLKKQGKKGEVVEVRASDIDANADVEIINKDLLITTLGNEKAKIECEIHVKRGIGYQFADESVRKEIGNLPIDSYYNPVMRVEVNISQARVGQRTDYDLITLEITTNKTKTPSEALLEAFEIYDIIANRLVNLAGGDAEALESETAPVEEKKEEEKILISEVNISTRLTNSLLNSGITTLNELDNKAVDEVLGFRGMGRKSFEELKEILSDFGFSLKE